MPGWATSFLTEGLAQGPMVIWNLCMYMAVSLMGYDFPFAPETGLQDLPIFGPLIQFIQEHSVYVEDIYNWFMGAGLVLLNLFCLIAFCRQASRLRENVTLEMWIELFVKVVVGNVLMLEGLNIIRAFLNVASSTSNVFLSLSNVDIVTSNIDLGAVLGYVLIGIFFLIGSVICGIMIVVTVAKRVINIYILTCIMPIACSTLAGGPEIERSGWAWLKTFLSTCFEIVIIALVFSLGGMLNAALQSVAIGDVNGWFDGFLSVLCDMIYMIFLTVSVAGAGGLLRRAFDLR